MNISQKGKKGGQLSDTIQVIFVHSFYVSDRNARVSSISSQHLSYPRHLQNPQLDADDNFAVRNFSFFFCFFFSFYLLLCSLFGISVLPLFFFSLSSRTSRRSVCHFPWVAHAIERDEKVCLPIYIFCRYYLVPKAGHLLLFPGFLHLVKNGHFLSPPIDRNSFRILFLIQPAKKTANGIHARQLSSSSSSPTTHYRRKIFIEGRG